MHLKNIPLTQNAWDLILLVRKANQEGGWIGYLENLETFSLSLENQIVLF